MLMKTIAFDREPGVPVAVPPSVETFVDSAIVTAGRPLFLPDFSVAWTALIYPAVKISRLGKTVRTRFARRYYSEMTLAMRLVPEDVAASLAAANAASGFLGCFDGAIALGRWLPVANDAEISMGDDVFTVDATSLSIDGCIAALSDSMTIKMGDIILPARLPWRTVVAPGSQVCAALNGEPVLDVKIK